ncbi:unnamed protein product [Lactuca virosa]|uniref:Uncharacterized protein n=1 Tax=Lactuca virosa TaxID=75947 RepID=A0AAU9PAV0_9ASTR|nr:unnamed protein product [Lactuca virosa]
MPTIKSNDNGRAERHKLHPHYVSNRPTLLQFFSSTSIDPTTAIDVFNRHRLSLPPNIHSPPNFCFLIFNRQRSHHPICNRHQSQHPIFNRHPQLPPSNLQSTLEPPSTYITGLLLSQWLAEDYPHSYLMGCFVVVECIALFIAGFALFIAGFALSFVPVVGVFDGFACLDMFFLYLYFFFKTLFWAPLYLFQLQDIIDGEGPEPRVRGFC